MSDNTPTARIEPGHTDTLRIERIVGGGDGLARYRDGRVVFVPRTAPGDLVRVTFTEAKKQFLRAQVTDLIEPSPARVVPPCTYYDRCGGCQLQHLSHEAQLTTKSELIVDAMRRIGHIEIDPPVVHAASSTLGYRNRVRFVLRRGREMPAGYHALDNPNEIVDVTRCPLAEDAINDAWQQLRDAFRADSSILPNGRELQLTLRAAVDGRVGLSVGGADIRADLEAIHAAVPAITSVWLVDERGDVVRYAGQATLTETWLDTEISVSGESFLQVNRRAAAALEAALLDGLGAVDGLRIVDAYCGYGLRVLELSRRGADVIGIERDAASAARANDLLSAASVSSRVLPDAVERALGRIRDADVVILNPPRAGLAPPVVGALRKMSPSRIVYQSCDPATLARDLKALGAPDALNLSRVEAFDLFPQTSHVETLVFLSA